MGEADPLRWLADSAWPHWLDHGVDWAAGAFLEALHPDGGERAGFRRLRVAARQTYVFASAAREGIPRAAEAAALGVAFLRRHARQPDGGYAWRFDLSNRPTDQTRDLYDHAFVLLAYAQAAGVLDDAGLAADARGVLAYVAAEFPHPEGGFREAVPDQLPRRQNPHMHLLEALLAAHVRFGEDGYLDLADELVDLFLDRLFDHESGALPEFFDATLAPVRDPEARFVVEPGHHFEWVWLLDWYLRQAAGREPRELDILNAMRALMRFAERHGVDAQTGLVLDVVGDDGAVIERGFRLWPQTERLKAVLCRPQLARTGGDACLALLQSYYRDDHPGLWHERRTPEGFVLGQAAPASSLYHLTCALLEARRLAR